MYSFLIIRLYQTKIARLEAVTNLVSPLVFAGVEIKKGPGTNCILINGEQHHVSENEESLVRVGDSAFVSFGYFPESDEVLD